MQELNGRSAVVTGGGSGIGRGIAHALADEGVSVVVADIGVESAESVAKELEAKGARAVAVSCDVTSEDSLAAASRAATDAFGAVHILSNNAGVIIPQGPMTKVSSDDWEFVFSVNVFGIVKSVQAFLPALRAHGGEAHIVNTASMAGLIAIPEIQVGVYTSSKYACVGYSEYLRAELAPENIGVSVLCPGMIESNLSATSARNRPERFGGPRPAPETGGPSRDDPDMPGVMSGEACGRVVVDGIRENRLHIVTHPETLPMVKKRFDQIRVDYTAEAAAARRRHAETT